MATSSKTLSKVSEHQGTLVLQNSYGDAFETEAKKQASKADSGVPPNKKYFRSRAHVNPFSHNDCFEYPKGPADYDWRKHYPQDPKGHLGPDFADIGCGFGGLSIGLAHIFPQNRICAFEIRSKVAEYVRLRIVALRNEKKGEYQNVGVVRTNTMKYLVNYFRKAQLEKIFICFPDPHFKAKNHRRRIITPALLDEYAYVLKSGGLLYMITDVKELYQWMDGHANAHPYFEKLSDQDLINDPALKLVIEGTEEGKKVSRMGGDKYYSVFRRRSDVEFRNAWVWNWD